MVEKRFGDDVKISVVENVPEGPDATRVIRELAKQGNEIIFTTSFGYMEPTLKVAKEFPNVKFEHITGYKRSKNVATGNIRFYEGRYIQGVVAGLMKLHKEQGSLSIETIMGPSIKFAEKGFQILPGESLRHKSEIKKLLEFKGTRFHFLKNNLNNYLSLIHI